MPAPTTIRPSLCARCTRINRHLSLPTPQSFYVLSNRRFGDSAPRPQREENDSQDVEKTDTTDTSRTKGDDEGHEGAMSRRLRDMSEEAIETGGRSTQKALSEAGFSEDLKRQLEERIASTSFRAEHRNAFAEVELPSHAGRGTRDIATADAWSGEESIHDASLRMLNDAHKPLRLGRGARIPGPSAQPPKRVDTGRSKAATGTRLANARDRSGIYATLKDSDMTDAEREKRFQELKDRFSPHARSVVPGTIQGLASLANERIEDAIARGQFKNLPRGKKLERDYNASNPFLDTTEYFMNKMIQKQDIVPPWIEKQQELVSTANKFRARLRNDWRRHAVRSIASKGGTLQEQMQRAEAYAKAELIANPPKKKDEKILTVDNSGHLSQISLSGQLKVPPTSGAPMEVEITAEKTHVDEAQPSTTEATSQTVHVQLSTAPPPSSIAPAPYPFRDPTWESTESAYHNLAINDLNSKTRSYNLQAPDLAKKPYYSLQRELNACYADVAPQLAEGIKERALAPKAKMQGFGESLAGQGSVMDRLAGGPVRVRDERRDKQYGLKQFWRDLWAGDKV